MYPLRITLVALICLSVSTLSAAAEGKGVKVGDKAPEFTLKDDEGNDWKSADHFGRKSVVVYFYPADMTGGCTKQACGFRDDFSELADKNVEVVGISGDSVRNHQLFKQAHDLNFTLLADTEGKVAKMFGVPYTVGEKSIVREINGKEETLVRNVTTRRWTFLVGPDGRIQMINDQVNAAEDSKAILKAVTDD